MSVCRDNHVLDDNVRQGKVQDDELVKICTPTLNLSYLVYNKIKYIHIYCSIAIMYTLLTKIM